MSSRFSEMSGRMFANSVFAKPTSASAVRMASNVKRAHGGTGEIPWQVKYMCYGIIVSVAFPMYFLFRGSGYDPKGRAAIANELRHH